MLSDIFLTAGILTLPGFRSCQDFELSAFQRQDLDPFDVQLTNIANENIVINNRVYFETCDICLFF